VFNGVLHSSETTSIEWEVWLKSQVWIISWEPQPQGYLTSIPRCIASSSNRLGIPPGLQIWRPYSPRSNDVVGRHRPWVFAPFPMMRSYASRATWYAGIPLNENGKASLNVSGGTSETDSVKSALQTRKISVNERGLRLEASPHQPQENLACRQLYL
jgi:hypothetical protein